MFPEKESARQMSSTLLGALILKHKLASLHDVTLAYQVSLTAIARIFITLLF
jgi:hypothetical protein